MQKFKKFKNAKIIKNFISSQYIIINKHGTNIL